MDERRHAQRRHEAALQIGEAFRSIRLARHLSQEQVALDAGLSVDTYAYLERGQMPLGGDANPRLDTLLRIFDVLDVEPPRLPQLPSTAGVHPQIDHVSSSSQVHGAADGRVAQWGEVPMGGFGRRREPSYTGRKPKTAGLGVRESGCR
ncbi:helix-turn-helix domain-containing protein [uncultured Microbacterium sp.]|uniref:helix-turn-helix domain-containing protein n=1 Tax=uncultured Microbacterium sp. TaxID=191216 RepID=UPI00345D9841